MEPGGTPRAPAPAHDATGGERRLALFERLLRNHPLANIAFVVVLLLGVLGYLSLPREQDPEINFNWVSILTILPGASAEDVERLVTNPLEDAIANVSDIRFVSSNSRATTSSILIRFREIDQRTFDKRISDLRREIQNMASSELPDEAGDPRIIEITTSNGFPTATIVLVGQADDETLRSAGRATQTDLERIDGVDQVVANGLRDPELQVRFEPARLAARGLTAVDVANSVRAWFRDTSAGTLRSGDAEWLIRLEGQRNDPEALAQIPVTGANGVTVRLDEVATVERARAAAARLASFDGRPAVLYAISKKSFTNTLALVERLEQYIDRRNTVLAASGLALVLSDDQTVPTREAISVMERNALQGLVFVTLVCFLFLGTRVALLVGIGIPFSLAGTFAILFGIDNTLNISVLLGVVIALGMLVDDAVVVVEAIYYRIQRGQETFSACVDGVREVCMPVLASVATTLAAFLPLMLLPGIVGKFMFVIPFVVTLALAISLLEAFWMMPTHVTVLRIRLDRPSRLQRWRNGFNRLLRLYYGKLLTRTMRHPWVFLLLISALLAGAATAFVTERVRVQFFAFDPIRIFYVNVDMPAGSSIDETLAETDRIERETRKFLAEGEARSLTSLAGVKFTETEPLYGDAYGQVVVALLPRGDEGRDVSEIVDSLRGKVDALPGPSRKSFTMLSGGPPTTKPVSVKVRGDDYVELRAAVDALLDVVRGIPGARDVVDDDMPGRPELRLGLDRDALRLMGLDAATVSRLLRLHVDGEVVSVLRQGNDRIDVRVQARERERAEVGDLLADPIALSGAGAGSTTTLGALVRSETRRSKGIVKHYNLRRSITVEADLDKEVTDTTRANAMVREAWEQMRVRYPGVDLDFSGELEDIQESLDAMGALFLLGVGLIYTILAAQFRSYFQPLLILVTVPLAFTGVTVGLLITGNPLSLYTMYGVIALAGIAVNSAIVLIDAMNRRLVTGIELSHAVLGAARRRVVPVLITTLTTIAGLFSLATGLGGRSLLWGPVASSIVWGLGVATLLTLFVVPMLYMAFMRRSARMRALA